MLQDAIFFAYFAPYPLSRHQQLIADMQCSPRVSLQILGQTLDGHDLDLLRLGDTPPPPPPPFLSVSHHQAWWNHACLYQACFLHFA